MDRAQDTIDFDVRRIDDFAILISHRVLPAIHHVRQVVLLAEAVRLVRYAGIFEVVVAKEIGLAVRRERDPIVEGALLRRLDAHPLESREIVIDSRAVRCHASRARREIRHVALGLDELRDTASEERGVLGWTVPDFALDVPTDDRNRAERETLRDFATDAAVTGVAQRQRRREAARRR